MEHIFWAGQKPKKSSTSLKGNIEICFWPQRSRYFNLNVNLCLLRDFLSFKTTYKPERWRDQTALKACFFIDFRLALNSGSALASTSKLVCLANLHVRVTAYLPGEHKPDELVARLFAQTTDLEMDYVKKSVFGVNGGAQIMEEDHPAMQELFKTRTCEIQPPLLCILLINDSQCFPFCIQTGCWMGCCSRRLTPKGTTRNQFWAQ